MSGRFSFSCTTNSTSVPVVLVPFATFSKHSAFAVERLPTSETAAGLVSSCNRARQNGVRQRSRRCSAAIQKARQGERRAKYCAGASSAVAPRPDTSANMRTENT